MATCLLCSSTVGDQDVVCPHCGGAVASAPLTPAPGPDITWASPSPYPEAHPSSEGWDLATDPDPPGPFGSGPPAPPPLDPRAGQYGPPTGSYGAGPQDTPAPDLYGAGPHGAAPYGSPPPGPYPAPPGAAPYGPFPQYYGVPVFVPAQPKVPTEGLAIASLITSIVGLTLGGACLVPILACPVGAVLGHVALRRVASSGKEGRGLALAGAIIGWVGTAFMAVGVAIFVAALSLEGGF